MRSLFSKFFLIPALAAGAAMLSHSAKAETLAVPFNFSVMGKTFPAGDYKVEKDLNANFVTLKLNDGSRSVTRILTPGSPDRGDHRVVLRFDAAGDNYSLDSIQFGSYITPAMVRHSHHREEAATHTTRTIVGQ